MQVQPEVLYANLTAENEPCVMESICPSCEKSGKTTLLMANIPFFKDIIIISFECEECGERNNEVQFGGKLADQGVLFQLKAESINDFDRECIKSEHGIIRIPFLAFEIPPNKSSVVNTIEGFIKNTIRDLQALQPLRHIQDPDNAIKIDSFLEKLQSILDGKSFPFIVELQDPSGNSYIQNKLAPKEDPQLKVKHYNRTREETEAMGYSMENEIKNESELVQEEPEQKNGLTQIQTKVEVQEQKNNEVQEEKKDQTISAHKHDFTYPISENDKMRDEAFNFTSPCHVCFREGEHTMCTISIPYFKDVMIMSFLCTHCNARSTEVKSGGEITPKGKIITLRVKSEIDLKRDLFKSETAGLSIPELDLELNCGTLGGAYTTVEGILEKILFNLKENNPFAGDSDLEFKTVMNKLFADIKNLQTGDVPFTLIIKDLQDNSFLQNPYHPEIDPNVDVEIYERTEEDDDFLGIDKMNTENYQQD